MRPSTSTLPLARQTQPHPVPSPQGQFAARGKRPLLLATSLLILCLPSVHAQTVRIRASVPFEFNLGEKVFPAGNYSVEIDKRSFTVAICNSADCDNAVLAASPAFRGEKDARKATLGFDTYGTAHFLKRIWLTGEWKGYVVAETKAERQLARSATAKASLVAIDSR